MKILPPRTFPPQSRIERRHRPADVTGRRGYQSFRPCLRWEFGFTCAFCLLHESDLAEHGVEGLGLMSVEHFIPVSAEDALINDYENCFYVCRFCNGARGTASTLSKDGRRLLNPCREVWGEHFFASAGDRLVPYSGDSDAVYTAQVYDLDDLRKIRVRRSRRERIEEWTALLGRAPGLLRALLARAQSTRSAERKEELLLAAHEVRVSLLRAVRDIRRYAAIPEDADQGCRCPGSEDCCLPTLLEEQMLEVDLPEE